VAVRNLITSYRCGAIGLLVGGLCAGLLSGCHHATATATTGAATAGAPGGTAAAPQNSALTNPNAVENQGGVDKQFMPGGGPPGSGGK
jgi:hypothetical protein